MVAVKSLLFSQHMRIGRCRIIHVGVFVMKSMA
jgi:hypothetical protein